MRYHIPLSQPFLSRDDAHIVRECVKSSWISSKSPYIEKFEKGFAAKVSKTQFAVSVNSGTSALFLALKALGIGVGDEVIIPSFTMIATINAVVWTGAKPVLVDSTSKEDWNMNVTQIEKRITAKTKAIIPVHIYGFICDMEQILVIAKKHKLFVIEDAAEAMGSDYRGKRAGSFGDISCFSLYANKIITTGNGGMVCMNDKNLQVLVKKLSFFDLNETIHFKHMLMGYNLVLSGLQGALGCTQLKKFTSLLERRRKIFFWYKKYLKDNKKISVVIGPEGQKPSYWFPSIIFKDTQDKVKTMKLLEKKKIETRDFFIPMHNQPVYKELFKTESYPISDYFKEHGLLLPSYFELTEKNVKHICDILNTI